MEEIDNTRSIAEQIFTKRLQPKNSIQLQLEEQTYDMALTDPVGAERFVMNIIGMITMHGVDILFGHRNILSLTENQINLLQEYTYSYGYKIITKVEGNNLLIGFEKVY
jgi:hypothetical protein